MRRPYLIWLTINGYRVNTIVIDSHYEQKHSTTVSDELILEIVSSLNGRFFAPDRIDNEGFEYYVTGPHYNKAKPYRLVWLLPLDKSYLGVVNCYRRPYGEREI